MNKRLKFILLLSAIVMLWSIPALSQQDTATMTGDVKDASGALVPKATVAITNTATNITIKSETNELGSYTVPNLRPGVYNVTVEKPGFNKTVRSGLILQVNQFARVDITLQTGGV